MPNTVGEIVGRFKIAAAAADDDTIRNCIVRRDPNGVHWTRLEPMKGRLVASNFGDEFRAYDVWRAE